MGTLQFPVHLIWLTVEGSPQGIQWEHANRIAAHKGWNLKCYDLTLLTRQTPLVLCFTTSIIIHCSWIIFKVNRILSNVRSLTCWSAVLMCKCRLLSACTLKRLEVRSVQADSWNGFHLEAEYVPAVRSRWVMFQCRLHDINNTHKIFNLITSALSRLLCVCVCVSQSH